MATQYGGGKTSRNPYNRGGGSAWARNSQGARANAQRMRPGRGMTEAKQYALYKGDELDRKFGFFLLPELLEQEEEARKEQPDAAADAQDHAKLGWLLNLRSCTLPDPLEGKNEVSGLELYFLEQDGKAFKTRIIYQPYFYVRPEANRSQDVIAYCLRKFEGLVAKAERVFREDLDMADHLNGKKALYVKLSFATVTDLMTVKRELTPLVARNQERLQARQAYEMQGQAREQVTEDDLIFGVDTDGMKGAGTDESESALLELREYDVPYPMRVAIDLDIRVGAWYHVDYDPTSPYAPSDVKRQKDMVDKAEPVVCAFDIECTKAPLKFPDAQVDQIYMISYMIDRQGYLIVNREFVSEDIQDFEYTPKEAYPGPFIVFNEENEEQLLKRFFEHILDEKPHIFVTYNGDFFDWPFIDARAQIHGINMGREIGISLDERSGEYRGRCSVHMDAFCWVKRDSYLPQGSQGLKAVTKYKLGYDPVEVDAEDMVALARDEPLKMASYSVSDAVATFYLYDKYVHLFVFSLCTIIPLGSEDVLRKGSGTLCEALLMVEAFEGNIVCPNKQSSAHEEKFYKGHLVESETYVGGHVECLESGVFRADFLYDFQLVPSAFQQLIDNIDRDLRFSLEIEMDVPLDRVANYNEVKKDIVDRLVALRERPNRKEQPLIYHLDVAAMYPNIILTNRLQPCAIVNEADCAACAYNTECGRAAIKQKDASCQREMDWVWRGDFYPATRPEYYSIKTQIEYENFSVDKPGGAANADPGKKNINASLPFAQLPTDKQELLLKQRFKSYCSSVYKKTKVTEEQKRSATVCMRENPFYVNTVRAFRDRRYEYKGLTKVWKKKVSQAAESKDLLAKIDAQNKCLVYDSLQLAHKCILNSFYGYVMRKGARWHSMEMAGIVTHTGSNIITGARELVEQIGRPLELDTDGIWAILPKSFPETFSFKLKDGGSRSISYPCVMLNADVHAKFTNPQYHELDPATGKYNTHKECSILFEVDGPYKAMVLPASTEEGKLLKKRYAVFNFDHSLAELKGFELKRRGEVPFTDWLKNRKKKWKSMLGKRRQEREERMRSFGGAGGFGMANNAHGSAKRFQSGSTRTLAAKGNGVGMENFVFDAGSALQREYWQIVEVQQEQGGLFTCWVLTAHSQMLQRITLKMPRVFYITCEEADQEDLLLQLPGARRVSRIVPHYSSKPQSVLEVMLSERQYQQYHKEISQILGDPHVKGVYELQVSALTRAVCALGCVAKVVNPHLSSTNQEYELSDLQFQSTAQASYLMEPQRSLMANREASSPPNSLMRRVLLYFAQQKKRAILGLVVLKEEDDDVSADSLGSAISEGDAHVWYVDPFSNVKSRGSDLKQFFDQLLQESQEEGGVAPIQSCSFKTHVVKTAQEAFSGVNATLARLASNKQLAPKPTIVVAQTCIPSSKRLREKIQGLHSFPIAMLPWNEEDTLFPALTWRKLMGEKMLTRCFEMTQYYSDVLDCARYAHLPVGNFTGDHSIAILDTLYSRILTKHKHLWWHSPTSLPDLGGKEQEQQFQQLFSQSLLGSAQQSAPKKGEMISQHRVDTSVVVCEKGSFIDVCVELELDGLAVNAILVASQIHSIEGLGVAHQMEIDFDGNADGEPDTKAESSGAAVAEGDAEESCHEAFRLLRLMVTTLFKDFLASRNKFADHVLQQFYRWLCSPNSLSFDPALHAMVKRLMEKLFLQLLAEFRRLGSQIVYADFSKIIVCTKKKSVRDAQTYLNFILQTVLSNELFQVLNFTPKKYFSNLFFMDAENYGCILLKNVVPEGEQEEENDHDSEGSDEKKSLSRLLGQFIRRRAEFQLRELQRLLKGGDAKHDVAEDPDEQPLDDDEKQLTPLAKYSQRLVSSYFSDKMLRLVPEILTYNMDRDSFPVFAGSHLAMESPALELVKFVCAVFKLEPNVEAQVGKMRRTLLKLLRTSEFGDEAQFRNPSLSFTVQDVICLCCNLCRSVDLCRDPQLFKGSASRSDEDDEGQENAEDAETASAWHCPRCFALYDKTAFEMRLVEMVQRSCGLPAARLVLSNAICLLSTKCENTVHAQARTH
ncbi:hypothetical protein KRP22_006875 [Phytophthora ramorum]|nr:DNA polymerase epsilon catalytic subunit A [Phytophthora ramorum]